MASEIAKTGKVVELSAFDKFIKHIQDRAEIDAAFSTAEELSEKQVLKLLEAQNEDELFAAMKLEGCTGYRDLENGADIQINGYKIVTGRPDMSGRVGVYCIADAVDLSTGETLALDSSIERIVTFLYMREKMTGFPVSVRVTKKGTQSGNEMITFAKIPPRAHQA